MNEELILKRKIYILFLLGGLLVAVNFVLGMIFGLGTWERWWVTNLLHFVGGAYAFFLARAMFIYTKERHGIFAKPWAEVALFIVGALVIGVFWEWFELAIDRYRLFILGKASIMTYADNIGDLIIDTFGAIVAALIYVRRK